MTGFQIRAAARRFFIMNFDKFARRPQPALASPSMGRLLLAGACLASAAFCARAEPAAFVQDQAHFEAAVEDDGSSEPYFVYVTVVDDKAGKSWTGCAIMSALEGAVHAEYGLAFDGAGIERARAILLAAKDHTYHFANPTALAKIDMAAYQASELDRARAYLHAHGTAFLLGQDWDKIDAANKLNRTALACAIIEKGLAARSATGTAETFAEP
jgi:hypothetical protein